MPRTLALGSGAGLGVVTRGLRMDQGSCPREVQERDSLRTRTGLGVGGGGEGERVRVSGGGNHAVIWEGRMASHKASPLLPQDPERPRETQSPGLPSSDSTYAQHCIREHCIPQILEPPSFLSPLHHQVHFPGSVWGMIYRV